MGEGVNGKRVRPLVPIRAIWDKDSISDYPETVKIPMDNGHVVTYRIDIQQPHPHFMDAMEILKNMPAGSYKKSSDL